MIVSNTGANGADEAYRSGLALVKRGKLDQAVTAFKKALEKDPKNCSFLDAMGGVYSLKGDLELAKEYFGRCLGQNPAFVPAIKNLAITDFSTGRYDQADAEFRRLSKASPASVPVANLFLGMIAEKNSNHSEAARFLEHSAELLNQYPEALLSLAEAELQLGNLPASMIRAISESSGSEVQRQAEIHPRRRGRSTLKASRSR